MDGLSYKLKELWQVLHLLSIFQDKHSLPKSFLGEKIESINYKFQNYTQTLN